MATLWIREFNKPGVASGTINAVNKPLQIALEPGIDQTKVTFSTSTQSAAFAATTSYIAMIADADFHYVVGDDPTATTNALKVKADTLLYIGVPPGQKIAVIAAS